MFNFIFKAIKAVANAVKSLFIEPNNVIANVELKEIKKLDYKPFRNPQTRPVWVRGLFDDYIYGRIKSLPKLDQAIREQSLERGYKQIMRHSTRC